MPSSDVRDLQPEIMGLALRFVGTCGQNGLIVRVAQTLRTWEEQDALYQQGRSLPGKVVTKAKPGSSFHNYGLAFDVCFVGRDPYLEQMEKVNKARAYMAWDNLGMIGKKLGLSWGGDFKTIKDRPHFEIKGLTISEAKELWPNGWKPGVSTLSQLKATKSVSPTAKGVATALKVAGKEEVHV